jgi:hypothetical protein
MNQILKLGTVSWNEGASERRCLVAPLPSDPSRVVDLNRVERLRLLKLGEGRAEVLADALVPPSLRQILESGPRGLQRVRQTLAYAEKWASRGNLPEALAPHLKGIRRLPCLPRPSLLRRLDGMHLDRLAIKGPGDTVTSQPQPALALIGMGAKTLGCCLAMEEAGGAALGGWLTLEVPHKGGLELRSEGHHRRVPFSTWEDLELPPVRAGEVLLLPAPKLRPLADLTPGSPFAVAAYFDVLNLRLDPEAPHPTVQ